MMLPLSAPVTPTAVHVNDGPIAAAVSTPYATTVYFDSAGAYAGPRDTAFCSVSLGPVSYYVRREYARGFANELTRLAAELVGKLDDRGAPSLNVCVCGHYIGEHAPRRPDGNGACYYSANERLACVCVGYQDAGVTA